MQCPVVSEAQIYTCVWPETKKLGDVLVMSAVLLFPDTPKIESGNSLVVQSWVYGHMGSSCAKNCGPKYLLQLFLFKGAQPFVRSLGSQRSTDSPYDSIRVSPRKKRLEARGVVVVWHSRADRPKSWKASVLLSGVRLKKARSPPVWSGCNVRSCNPASQFILQPWPFGLAPGCVCSKL